MRDKAGSSEIDALSRDDEAVSCGRDLVFVGDGVGILGLSENNLGGDRRGMGRRRALTRALVRHAGSGAGVRAGANMAAPKGLGIPLANDA